jgi:uncharacterized protein YuzE
MVCPCCKHVVQDELCRLEIPFKTIEMGEIETMKEVDPEVLKKMGVNLEVFGLEIMEDRRIILVEKIKLAIIEMIYFTEETPKMNFSDFLMKQERAVRGPQMPPQIGQREEGFRQEVVSYRRVNRQQKH